ncbi:hypothetical protein PMAYCL1PPCAC_22318, partial [Pristionchus mayeri]
TQEMGLYKYLLFIFIINDIVYTMSHIITHPVILNDQGVFYMFSANFPKRWVASLYATSHSNSFCILCFHFVYRHIAVSSPDGLRMFRRWWFISLLVLIFLLESIMWFILCYFFYAPDTDSFRKLCELVKADYPNIHAESAVIAAHWVILLLAIVIYSAVRTLVALNKNLNNNSRGFALQRQLYYTLLVQFSVPFFVMYVPVCYALLPGLFDVRISFPGDIEPIMFSVYPSLDALVILFGVHDYR